MMSPNGGGRLAPSEAGRYVARLAEKHDQTDSQPRERLEDEILPPGISAWTRKDLKIRTASNKEDESNGSNGRRFHRCQGNCKAPVTSGADSEQVLAIADKEAGILFLPETKHMEDPVSDVPKAPQSEAGVTFCEGIATLRRLERTLASLP